METSNYVIWIDQNITNAENTVYSNELKLKLDSFFRSFKDVKSAIEFLKTILFIETKVIVSGRLYLDFIEQYKKNIAALNIIPKIVIFTSHKGRFIDANQKYLNIIENPLYNYGGIQTDFEGVKEFIKKKVEISSLQKKIDEVKINEISEYNDNKFTEDEMEEMTFDYIDCLGKLCLQLFFKALIDIPSDTLEDYTISLCDKFSKENSKIKELLEQIIIFEKPNIEILCKYYIRAYTMQKSLYGDLNKDSIKNKIIKNLPFVKLLYAGVKLKSFPLASEQELYRGTEIFDNEILKIKDYLKNKNKGLPAATAFSKSFLSFSKEKKIALGFFGKKKKDFSRVLFMLKKDKDIDYSLSTHADIDKISYYPNDKEVLFFPFSSFEIKDVREVNENKYEYEIDLLYLGKYIEIIKKDKDIIEKGIKLPDCKFKDEIINTGLIQPEIINKINTKELFDYYIQYKKDVDNSNIKNEIEIELKIEKKRYK